MPDPFSIALGVVQVADTGFKLAETIYTYTNSVRKAEKQLQPIADYVKLTSTVLQQVASHLQDEDLKTLYKPALLVSADDALKGCEGAFEKLNTYLKTLIKDGNDGERAVINTKAKMTWLWKQKEFDGHQIHLERYKSTFDLLLSTLTFVSSSRTAKDTLGMKLELQRLVNAEAAAKRKEAKLDSMEASDLPRDFSARDNTQLETSRDIYETPAAVLMNNIVTNALQPASNELNAQSIDEPASTTEIPQPSAKSDDTLLFCLNECAAAMEKLSATLKDAIKQREQSRKHKRGRLWPDFETLHAAIKKVSECEETLHMDTPTVCVGQRDNLNPQAEQEFQQLRTMLKNTLQSSRMEHFALVPIPLPGSQPESRVASGTATPNRRSMAAGSGEPLGEGSPKAPAMHSPPLTPAGSKNRDSRGPTSGSVSSQFKPAPDVITPQRSESPQRQNKDTAATSRKDATGAISSHPKQPPKFSLGLSGDAQPPSGEQSSAGIPASTAPSTPRPKTPSETTGDSSSKGKRPSQIRQTQSANSQYRFGNREFSLGPSGDAQPPSGEQSSAGTPGITVSRIPRPKIRSKTTADSRMRGKHSTEPLEGKMLHKQGLVFDEHGIPFGRIVEGNASELAGRLCDKDGIIYNDTGNPVGRCERVPEDQREGQLEDPFAGSEDLRVVNEGWVEDENGNRVGELVKGDIEHLMEMVIDQDGDIVDKYGNLKGHAVPGNGGYYTAGDAEAAAIYHTMQAQQREEYSRGSRIPAASAKAAPAQLHYHPGPDSDWGGHFPEVDELLKMWTNVDI